ncbi:hypothetical protein TB2_015047 [Malus domestica]
MFSDQDFEQVCTLHDDAFIVTLQIAYVKMSCILIDGEAEVNLFFKDTMEHIRLLNDITKTRSILKAFERTFVQILGTLKLLVVVGPYSPMINLHVVVTLSPHNAILERN